MKTMVTFLGTADVVPEAMNDTTSILLNGTHLIDAGWNSPLNMLRFGFDPLDMQCLLLTHCHHDHYLGLAAILFYLRMRQKARRPQRVLQIFGPEADIYRTLERARSYLQIDRFPELELMTRVTRVRPGDSFETEQFDVSTAAALHPVQGIVYRLRDKVTGVTLTISGDTAPNAHLTRLAERCDLLIHEASFGASPATKGVGHSSAIDAAHIASAAQVKQLALVHCPQSLRDEALRAAQQIFPHTFLPAPGQTVEVAAGGASPHDCQKFTSS